MAEEYDLTTTAGSRGSLNAKLKKARGVKLPLVGRAGGTVAGLFGRAPNPDAAEAKELENLSTTTRQNMRYDSAVSSGGDVGLINYEEGRKAEKKALDDALASAERNKKLGRYTPETEGLPRFDRQR
jgi:hypothetical protein